VPERLGVLSIFDSGLPSSFIDKVNIISLELVLRGFIVCLDMEGAHVDFRREDNLSPVHQEERCFSGEPTG
jgi:hypothetical protein